MVKLKFRSSIRYMRIILLVVTYIYLEISFWFEPGPKDQVEVSPGGLVQDGIAIRIVWTGPSSAKSIFLALRPALPPLSPPSSRSSSPPIQVAGASETESASAPPLLRCRPPRWSSSLLSFFLVLFMLDFRMHRWFLLDKGLIHLVPASFYFYFGLSSFAFVRSVGTNWSYETCDGWIHVFWFDLMAPKKSRALLNWTMIRRCCTECHREMGNMKKVP